MYVFVVLDNIFKDEDEPFRDVDFKGLIVSDEFKDNIIACIVEIIEFLFFIDFFLKNFFLHIFLHEEQ